MTALAPHVADVVVTGHDRSEIGLLVFTTPQAKALTPADLAAHIRSGLQALRATGGGSSQTPARALVMDEPPSVDVGEITDKGYINQRAVITHRADLVELLYAASHDPRVIDA